MAIGRLTEVDSLCRRGEARASDINEKSVSPPCSLSISVSIVQMDLGLDVSSLMLKLSSSFSSSFGADSASIICDCPHHAEELDIGEAEMVEEWVNRCGINWAEAGNCEVMG